MSSSAFSIDAVRLAQAPWSYALRLQ